MMIWEFACLFQPWVCVLPWNGMQTLANSVPSAVKVTMCLSLDQQQVVEGTIQRCMRLLTSAECLVGTLDQQMFLHHCSCDKLETPKMSVDILLLKSRAGRAFPLCRDQLHEECLFVLLEVLVQEQWQSHVLLWVFVQKVSQRRSGQRAFFVFLCLLG